MNKPPAPPSAPPPAPSSPDAPGPAALPEGAAEGAAFSATGLAQAGPHSRARPVRTFMRLLLPLAVVLALVAALGLAVFGAARWTLATEEGTQWLLARLPNVQARGVRGALLGGKLQAESLRIEWAGGKEWLLLEGVDAEGLRWQWQPAGAPRGVWLALDAQRLQLRKATVETGPPSPRPLKAPASLALPLQLSLAMVRIEELQVDQLAPITQLQVQQLLLDSRAGARHAAQQIQGRWQGWDIQGQASIGHAAPLPVTLQASLTPTADGAMPRWALAVRAEGPLERLETQATLRGVPQGARPAPSLDLRAEVLPLQAWLLGRLSLQTNELDLRALHASAPETRLSGSAQVLTRAKDAPVAATVNLVNEAPGRWNEGRLPVKSATLQVLGRIDQPDRLELPSFDLLLADGPGPGPGPGPAGAATHNAGRWQGKALWQAHNLTLETQLTDVMPQRLDGRAAGMRLSGPLALTLSGLPSPGPATATPVAPWQGQLRLDLQGLLDGAAQDVQLKLEARANAQRLEVQSARLQAGAATAQASATLQRAAQGEWQLTSAGQLASFDPLPWFPGEPGSAWRQGPHRLSGGWQFDLRLPAQAWQLLQQSPLALAQRWAGNGTLRVRDSLLAGVAVQADAVLKNDGSATPASGGHSGSLHAELLLGGNELLMEGQGDPTGSGSSDRWRATLKAAEVASLAPLIRLFPAAADWAPRQGQVDAVLTTEGRWPALRTEGNARSQQLQLGGLSLARGQLDWKLDSGDNQPLLLTVDLSGLAWGKQRADAVRGQLSGTLANHRIDIDAALPLAPPPATETLLGLQTRAGTRAQLRGQGSWTPEAGGGGRWRAGVERLSVGAWDGRPLAAPDTAAMATVLMTTGAPANAPASAAASAAANTVTALAAKTTANTPAKPSAGADTPGQGQATWADARDLQAELRFDADGDLVAASAQAGRVRLADTATLRWDEVQIDLQAQPIRVQLRAEVEPFNVVPLLARLQPDMGWSGNLRLNGRVLVQAGERFAADVLVQRVDGDLAIAEGGSAQPMGLSELQGSLVARDGLWRFKTDINGRASGEIRGSAQARATPQARWPAAEAPIEGQLQMDVADIGIWNSWIPAGWRTSGEMRGSAALSGRFGDPRYTGEIVGKRLSLRNLLQGVNVGDGEVTIRLAGDSAQIERFALRGGEGTLTVEGNAKLGATPTLQLQMKAERFRVLGRVDRQIITSGNATLALANERFKLDGNLVVDEGLYDTSRANAPSLDEDVSVRRAGEEEFRQADVTAARPRANVQVNIGLDLGNKLRIRGRGLETVLGGKLRLTTPGGRLAVNGTINTEGGTYAAYGQKLDIERGFVAFSGVLDNPRLDVLALRPNIDMRVGVAITGNLLTPRVRLFSEPDLSDNEKLSWLVLGRAPDGLGRTDTALLQRAAVALLAGEGEAPTDALIRSLGIDELSLRQSDGDVRETVVSLGKQLSRRWYLGYERGVNSTTGTWQLIYRIAQQFTLRAQSGLENSLDAIWVWRVGKTPEPLPGSVRKSVTVPP